MKATGPIKSGAYGTLTSENVAQKLVIDAYEKALTRTSATTRTTS